MMLPVKKSVIKSCHICFFHLIFSTGGKRRKLREISCVYGLVFYDSFGVFYLEQSYLRAASVVLKEASEMEIDDGNPNGNIYATVSSICRSLAIANGWQWDTPDYIACWQNELAKYPASSLNDGTVSIALPSTELYRREFSSPVWAPSVSGFVILVTAILAVVIFIRFLIWLCLEITLIIMKKS